MMPSSGSEVPTEQTRHIFRCVSTVGVAQLDGPAVAAQGMTSPATHKTSRTILASRRAIFRTLLDPETIPTWRARRDRSVQIAHFQPRPGGTYRMVLTNVEEEGEGYEKPSQMVHVIRGEFVEILPDERIVEAVRFETDDVRYEGVMTITTLLETLKDGTKVTLIAENVPMGIREADYCEGMDTMLRSLANFVE